MSGLTCVIAGCALVHGGRWVSGDLFRDEGGNVYVFNGNVGPDGRPQWNGGEPCYGRQFALEDWWERRGVFVFAAPFATFNEEATEYMNR